MEASAQGVAVTVAVVSYNTRELLLRCLDSLRPDAVAGGAEVWVVDNASRDGSAAAARRHAPWSTVLEPRENLGFGRGVNLVAGQTQAPWLLVANADIALAPGALGQMLAAGADPRVGCVAPRLLLPDGSTQHSVHPFPSLGLMLAFNLGLHHLDRRLADRLCLEGYWDSTRERAVPWALGACLLVRRSAFAAVGGFDPAQWLYAEDLDLGWRLHQRGWLTRYVPSAVVHHQASAATEAAFGAQRRARYLAATYTTLERHHGRARSRATAVVNVAGAAARLAWMSPLALASPRWRGRWADTRAWLRGHVQALRAGSTLRKQW